MFCCLFPHDNMIQDVIPCGRHGNEQLMVRPQVNKVKMLKILEISSVNTIIISGLYHKQ